MTTMFYGHVDQTKVSKSMGRDWRGPRYIGTTEGNIGNLVSV